MSEKALWSIDWLLLLAEENGLRVGYVELDDENKTSFQ